MSGRLASNCKRAECAGAPAALWYGVCLAVDLPPFTTERCAYRKEQLLLKSEASWVLRSYPALLLPVLSGAGPQIYTCNGTHWESTNSNGEFVGLNPAGQHTLRCKTRLTPVEQGSLPAHFASACRLCPALPCSDIQV